MSLVPQTAQRDSESARSSSRLVHSRGGNPCLVAIDLGAESCRVSLLTWAGERPCIRLVHRFANAPVEDGIHLRWNLARIRSGILEGLRICAELAPEGIRAIGVDGWAVDYVRLSATGQPIGDPFCYRDQRTIDAQKDVLARISAQALYQHTGIQFLPLNTLYQLYADKSCTIPDGAPWLNLPEFVLHSFGARPCSEYTNATHTQMVALENRSWCAPIFCAAGLDINAAPTIVPPGSIVGQFRGPLASLPAFRDTALIAPACHDTASAVAGIPDSGKDWAFISSGTWSLVGCVLDSPCANERALQSNFSNEGGIGGKFNFLKNVNGMWLLQQCMQYWAAQGMNWSWEDLIASAAELPTPELTFDVNDPDLLLPGDMPARINAQLERAGVNPVAGAPQITNLILHSLAARYASVLRDLASITGHQLQRIYVVGGGNRNWYLNRLTEQATGLEVILGPTESATIGNFSIQLAALSDARSETRGVDGQAVVHWAAQLSGMKSDSQAKATQL